MDVLKVHAEKKIPGSNLTLTFGPLSGAPRLKMADFGGFGTQNSEYLQDKKISKNVFDRARRGEFIFVIWGSWGVRCGPRSSLHKFALFWIPGPPWTHNARLRGGCFRKPLRNLKIPPFTRYARPAAHSRSSRTTELSKVTAERKNGGIFRSLRWPEFRT